MAGFNLAISNGETRVPAGSVGTWVTMIACGFVPLGFVIGPMLMQIFGLWPY